MSSKAAVALTKIARMRIIALPLTSEASTSGLHTYYHFQTPPPVKPKGNPSLLKKTTEKAAGIWAGFGKAPKGSWKHRTFTFGERMMDRIEFEELSLKTMDPSLGPKLSKLGRPDIVAEEKEKLSIPLVYPSFYGQASPLQHLQALLKKRTPKHRKGCYLWLLVSPLTAPFMIVPIIPNLPFFFCVWRSWHHYRAYKASSYLESLVQNGAIQPEESTALNEIYKQFRPVSSNSDASAKSNATLYRPSKEDDEEQIVLSKDAVPKIISLFELPPSAAADLYRALDQTEVRLKKE